jgi:hypothetical protein
VAKASFLDDVLAQPRTKRNCWADELPPDGKAALAEIIAGKASGRVPPGYMAAVYRKFCAHFGNVVNVHSFREYVNAEARNRKATK